MVHYTMNNAVLPSLDVIAKEMIRSGVKHTVALRYAKEARRNSTMWDLMELWYEAKTRAEKFDILNDLREFIYDRPVS